MVAFLKLTVWALPMDQEWVILRQKPSKEVARIDAHSDMVRKKEIFYTEMLIETYHPLKVCFNLKGEVNWKKMFFGSYLIFELVRLSIEWPSVAPLFSSFSLSEETVLYWLLLNYENMTGFEHCFNYFLFLGQLIVSKVFVGNAAPVKSENKYVHWRSVISQSDY